MVVAVVAPNHLQHDIWVGPAATISWTIWACSDCVDSSESLLLMLSNANSHLCIDLKHLVCLGLKWMKTKFCIIKSNWGCPADLLTNQTVLDPKVHCHTSRALKLNQTSALNYLQTDISPRKVVSFQRNVNAAAIIMMAVFSVTDHWLQLSTYWQLLKSYKNFKLQIRYRD